MSARLVDTNIVSFAVQQHPIHRKYRRHLAGHVLLMAFQSHGELLEWAADRHQWSPIRQQRFLTILLGIRVLHFDDLIDELWASIRHQRRQQPISTDDAWIAATALAYGLELVTHNPADFTGISGLRIISESP